VKNLFGAKIWSHIPKLDYFIRHQNWLKVMKSPHFEPIDSKYILTFEIGSLGAEENRKLESQIIGACFCRKTAKSRQNLGI